MLKTANGKKNTQRFSLSVGMLCFKFFFSAHSFTVSASHRTVVKWKKKRVYFGRRSVSCFCTARKFIAFPVGLISTVSPKELMLTESSPPRGTISRCPPGYSGLSCEMCSSGFERVPGGSYFGTCAGCNCNGHASACDPISGQCLVITHSFCWAKSR